MPKDDAHRPVDGLTSRRCEGLTPRQRRKVDRSLRVNPEVRVRDQQHHANLSYPGLLTTKRQNILIMELRFGGIVAMPPMTRRG